MSETKWFQKLFYKETVLAIKSSLNFLSYESFKNDLILQLPQESQKSKARIANNILHRLFPDKKLFTPLVQIWEAYQDDQVLDEAFRYYFLSKETIIAEFFIKNIFQKEPGKQLFSNDFADFIIDKYKEPNQNLTWWLQGALRDLGFIERVDKVWRIKAIRTPETVFLLLLHNLISPYPSTIPVQKITENDFWKYIGIRDIKTVKTILEKAYAKKLINILDENITTLHSFDNLLMLKPRLET